MDEGLPISGINRSRALRKLLLVIAIVAAVLALLVGFVSAKTVNGLINHLNLGLLVALIVIANLVSLLIVLALYAAWRWIRRDLDPEGAEED